MPAIRRVRGVLSVVIAPAAIGVIVAALVVLATASGFGAVATRAAGDLLWPSGAADPRIVVVAIDQESLREYGDWPWSRDRQAELITTLLDAGVSVVAYDVTLGGGVDDEISAAIAGEPVVLVDPLDEVADGDRWPVATARLSELDSDAAAGTSLIGADPDGVTRTLPAVIESPEGLLVPTLGLAAVELARDGEQAPIRAGGATVSLGSLAVPVESGSRFRPSWSSDVRTVSAADVLSGSANALDGLDGAIVFVGVTAPALGDSHTTPAFGAATPGVAVHAAVADTAVRAAWVRPWPWWLGGLVTLVGVAAIAPLALRRRLRWTPIAVVAAVAVVTVGAIIAFQVDGWLPDLVRPIAGIVIGAAGAVGLRAVLEQSARRRVDELFGRYVPEQVVRSLVASGATSPAGERMSVAVLFCDIRGFTPIAENAEPEVVQQLLDRYYDRVCAEIFERDGTVIQFVGDEVFAVFGAPVPMPDAVRRAVETARGIQAAALGFAAELVNDGLPAIAMGVGVHAGPVVVAHLGPERRRQYSVMGDAVNVGSRLCGIAGPGEVVVSSTVAAALDDLQGIAETVTVKGHAAPVGIRRLLAPG